MLSANDSKKHIEIEGGDGVKRQWEVVTDEKIIKEEASKEALKEEKEEGLPR